MQSVLAFSLIMFCGPSFVDDESSGVAKEKEQLQGLWQAVAWEANGKEAPSGLVGKFRISFRGDKVAFLPDKRIHTYYIDPKSKPSAMDITARSGPKKGKRLPCAIYKLSGDTLTICIDKEGRNGIRPTEFETKPGDGLGVISLKRFKTDKERIFPHVTGKVLRVSEKNENFALISVGSDDGVLRGMTLEVFSPGQYRGKVKVIEVSPKESIVQVIRDYSIDQILPNDQVVTRFKSREAEGTPPEHEHGMLGVMLDRQLMLIEVFKGPASRAGLEVGDRITALNGQTVTDVKQLMSQVWLTCPGDKVAICVDRGGQDVELNATHCDFASIVVLQTLDGVPANPASSHEGE